MCCSNITGVFIVRHFISALAFLALASGSPVLAEDEGHHVFSSKGIEIVHPWARAAAVGEDALVFFEVHNEGSADRLIGAQSTMAGGAHVVGLVLEGDGAGVQEIEAIDVPAGEFAFDPGGLAIALHDLNQGLAEGQVIPVTLIFEKAGTIHVEVAVEAANAAQHSHAGHAH